MGRLPLRAALVLGTVIGVMSMVGPFMAVTLLPGPLQIVMPVLLLAIPVFIQWPRRFDLATDPWAQRVLRRLVLIAAAALVAAVVGWIEFTAIPSYSKWSDAVHRRNLESAGKNPEEIEATVAQHHQTAGSFAFENAIVTAAPGTVAALVTLGAAAIAVRRKAARP